MTWQRTRDEVYMRKGDEAEGASTIWYELRLGL